MELLRLEYPRTASQVEDGTDPSNYIIEIQTIEIQNPLSWVWQLVHRYAQAQKDLRYLYDVCGNEFDRQDRRL